ncbi:MAG TPA: alanine racemase [Chloroflexota bacterium]|jgi:ornithine decarboxylase
MPAVLYLGVARAVADYAAVAAAVRPLRVRYAAKANPHPALLGALAAAGAGFAVTSRAELEALLVAGVTGARIACVTPGPPASLLRRARAADVREYAVDSVWELRKVAALAPGAAVLVALAGPPAGRLRYPAARLGVALDGLDALLAVARWLPVELAGVAVHVGSQCERLAPWRAAAARAGVAWQRLEAAGYAPHVLSLGGGLPVSYRQPVPPLASVAGTLHTSLVAHFDPLPVEIWLEPGRYVAAGAGVLAATVLAREERAGRRPRLTLDVGRYDGLPEAALGIRYPYRVPGRPEGTGEADLERCVLLGPRGAVDVLDPAARLPRLAPGDRLELLQAGAYTACQAAYAASAAAPAAEVRQGPAGAAASGGS